MSFNIPQRTAENIRRFMIKKEIKTRYFTLELMVMISNFLSNNWLKIVERDLAEFFKNNFNSFIRQKNLKF
jgi:hypothetical protein